MRVSELPHMGELPNPHGAWVSGQLPHFPISGPGGPVPGLSIRALGRRLNAAPVQEKNARARQGRVGPLSRLAAAAVTERASCQPHRPLPWLSPLRARPPRSLVSFWLPPTKVKGKVVGRCPTPCKPFEKGLTENFMLALPWFFLHLSSSGTYFWSTGKARYAGRIIRPPVVSSSMRWAHQPAMRLTANMGVNKSSGMPSISYTSPE